MKDTRKGERAGGRDAAALSEATTEMPESDTRLPESSQLITPEQAALPCFQASLPPGAIGDPAPELSRPRAADAP